MEILTQILTIVLVLVSIFLVLVVLMQRGSANGGLGAAMGGGMAESALGAESTSVLSKVTTRTAIVFFVMVLGIYLMNISAYESAKSAEQDSLPEFEMPAAVETESLPEIPELFEAPAEAATNVEETAENALPGLKEEVESAVEAVEQEAEKAAEAVK